MATLTAIAIAGLANASLLLRRSPLNAILIRGDHTPEHKLNTQAESRQLGEGHILTWQVDGEAFELQVIGDAATLWLPDGQVIDMSNHEWTVLTKAIHMAIGAVEAVGDWEHSPSQWPGRVRPSLKAPRPVFAGRRMMTPNS
jgi:hypothetical protein